MELFFHLHDAGQVGINRLEARLPRYESALLAFGHRARVNRVVLIAGTKIPRAARHIGLEVLDVAERLGDRSAVDLSRIQLQERIGRRQGRQVAGLREGVALIARLAERVEYGVPVVDIAPVLVERLELKLDEYPPSLAPIGADRFRQ